MTETDKKHLTEDFNISFDMVTVQVIIIEKKAKAEKTLRSVFPLIVHLRRSLEDGMRLNTFTHLKRERERERLNRSALRETEGFWYLRSSNMRT